MNNTPSTCRNENLSAQATHWSDQTLTSLPYRFGGGSGKLFRDRTLYLCDSNAQLQLSSFILIITSKWHAFWKKCFLQIAPGTLDKGDRRISVASLRNRSETILDHDMLLDDTQDKYRLQLVRLQWLNFTLIGQAKKMVAQMQTQSISTEERFILNLAKKRRSRVYFCSLLFSQCVSFHATLPTTVGLEGLQDLLLPIAEGFRGLREIWDLLANLLQVCLSPLWHSNSNVANDFVYKLPTVKRVPLQISEFFWTSKFIVFQNSKGSEGLKNTPLERTRNLSFDALEYNALGYTSQTTAIWNGTRSRFWHWHWSRYIIIYY